MIQVGIIGIGAISQSHIDGYTAFPQDCRIVAMVDRDVERAKKKIVQSHLKEAKAYSSLEEMLENCKVDLVSICLPPSLHCETTVKMLERGIHVLCEKPLAPTLEECDRMLKAAKDSGAVLSTVAQNRFKPDVKKVRNLIESGCLGKILFGQATSLWWRGTNYYNLSWRGKWETEGGGCTLIHGIHHIDLFLWMMGKVESVTAVVANEARDNSEVEDLSMGMVRFVNGSVGNVVSSLLHHGEDQRLLLDGEYGTAELPLKLAASSQMENGFPEPNEKKLAQMKEICESVETKYTGHTAQIRDVLEAIQDNRPVGVSGEDGRRAIEFISAVYQSAFTHQTVHFPMTSKDPFYSKEGIIKHAVKFHEKTVSIDGFQNNEIQVGGTL